jgi:hypothetical protein
MPDFRPRLRSLLLCVAGLIVLASPRLHAGWWSAFQSNNDLDVITVTDVTAAGKLVPAATPQAPVYYMILNLGERHFGPDWTGEKMPAPIRAMRLLEQRLAAQGYRLADRQHPPTQLFVYAWGLLSGNQGRQALHFLGAEKTDLRWQLMFPGTTPLARTGLADQIWEMASDDLFLCVLRSYTVDSLRGPKTTLLWETRIASPSIGFSFRDSLPLMLRAAAPHFGRDTATPVAVDASTSYHVQVIMGELRVIEDDVPLPPSPTGKSAGPKR